MTVPATLSTQYEFSNPGGGVDTYAVPLIARSIDDIRVQKYVAAVGLTELVAGFSGTDFSDTGFNLVFADPTVVPASPDFIKVLLAWPLERTAEYLPGLIAADEFNSSLDSQVRGTIAQLAENQLINLQLTPIDAQDRTVLPYPDASKTDGSSLAITMKWGDSPEWSPIADQAEIDSLDIRVTANTTAIATNTADIAANTTAVTSNTTEIGLNRVDITNNTTAIATNTADIAANTTAITSNTTEIGVNRVDITNNTTAIATNTTAISANTSAISSNTTEIGVNRVNIDDITTVLTDTNIIAIRWMPPQEVVLNASGVGAFSFAVAGPTLASYKPVVSMLAVEKTSLTGGNHLYDLSYAFSADFVTLSGTVTMAEGATYGGYTISLVFGIVGALI